MKRKLTQRQKNEYNKRLKQISEDQLEFAEWFNQTPEWNEVRKAIGDYMINCFFGMQ